MSSPSTDNSVTKDNVPGKSTNDESAVAAASSAAAAAAATAGADGDDQQQYMDVMSKDPFVNTFFDCCRFNDSAECLPAIVEMLSSEEGKEKKLLQQQDISGGRTALHMASANGHVEVMKVLLEAGADPNAKSGASGATPLHDAVLARGIKAVPLLLAKSASPAAKNISNETPLQLAEKLGYEDLASLLLKMDTSIETYQNASGKIVMEQVEDDEQQQQQQPAAEAAAAASSSTEEKKQENEPKQQQNAAVDVDDVE